MKIIPRNQTITAILTDWGRPETRPQLPNPEEINAYSNRLRIKIILRNQTITAILTDWGRPET